MTKADQIVEQLHELKKQMLSDSGRVELKLADPTDAVLDAIESAGGKIGRSEWEQWCLSSATCGCTSHSEGQASTFVEVNPEWLLTEKRGEDVTEVFDVNDDPDTVHPILIIPSETPALVWESQSKHWAGRVQLSQPR